MSNNIFSALSLLVALAGVSLNAFCTRPFVGGARYTDENKPKSELPGRIGNYLILGGTVGQLIAVLWIIFY